MRLPIVIATVALLAGAAFADDQLAAVQPASKFDPAATSASSASWRISSGFDVISGDYGAARATRVSYLPLGLGYTAGLWTLSADGGYIDVTGPRSFVDIAEFGISEDEGRALGVGTDATVQGFDNVTLGARYAAFDIWTQNLFIDVTGKVTVPTASRAKGLGAGAVDYAVIVDATRLAGRTTFFASVGHKWRGGDPVTRRNSWSAGTGFFRALTDRLSAGLGYDLRQSGVAGGKVTHEGTVFASFKLTESATVTTYALTGVPRATVGSGLGVRLSYGF